MNQRLTVTPDGTVVVSDKDGNIVARGSLVTSGPLLTSANGALVTSDVRFIGEAAGGETAT